MRYQQIDSPSEWCIKKAFQEILPPLPPSARFIDVGAGEGRFSELLLARGYTGLGLDRSAQAVERMRHRLSSHIDAGAFRAVEGDILHAPLDERGDLVFSIFVMEHVPDDVAFLRQKTRLLRPGGTLVTAVPGRPDRWSATDELYGHLRRYSRPHLASLFHEAGLSVEKIWSVSVPVSNILFPLSTLSAWWNRKGKETSSGERTAESGLRDLPGISTFPLWSRLFLNRFTMAPVLLLQKLFYNSDLGLILLARGRASGDKE